MSKSSLIPSAKCAVKRSFYIEKEDWDATIKVDYDTNRNPISIRRIRSVAKFLHKHKLDIVKIVVSTTRKGYHLRIWLDKPIGPYRTLRIQSLLGDDPQRQKFNRIRVRRKMNFWNILFNQKWIGKTLAWKESPDQLMTKLVWSKLSEEKYDDEWTQRIGRVLGTPA